MSSIRSPDAASAPKNAAGATAGPKLRDSCHACSASKVKCSREKPTCSRCARRGVDCEYLATRRSGRKHTNKNNSNNSNGSGSGSRPIGSSTTADMAPSPHSHVHLSPTQQAAYEDSFANFLAAANMDGGPGSSATLPSLNVFDDFFTSPMSPPDFDPSADANIAAQFHDYCGGAMGNGLLDPSSIGDDAFFMADDPVAEPRSRASMPRSPMASRPPTGDDNSSTCQADHDASESSASCCLIRALTLLKKLFQQGPTACMNSKSEFGDNDATATHRFPTIQAAVTENAQTIEAISSMLECTCSQDDYLLTVMSLIIFKVLGWYAAAARGSPVTTPGESHGNHDSAMQLEQVSQLSTTVSSDGFDGDEDQGRMARQLVLGELHRAQRMVNLLSQRLKSRRLRNAAPPQTASSSPSPIPNSQSRRPNFHDGLDTPGSCPEDQKSPSPFSSSLLDQLEEDLRKCLRTLSLEIVSTLRQA